MENQENLTPAPTPRQMLHLQVSGNPSQEDLMALIQEFGKTLEEGGIIATPNNVVANLIRPSEELAGLILTPKMTALEIAAIVVEAINAFNLAQGSDATPTFGEMEQDAQLEVLKRIQCVLRFGGLPPTTGDVSEVTRDAIFVSLAHSLGTKLSPPNIDNIISVTKVAQNVDDEDTEVKFDQLVSGDIFKHGDGTFIAESDPYVNWIAHPFPVITLDAKVYAVPEQTSVDDVKVTSTAEESQVQSTDSNS